LVPALLLHQLYGECAVIALRALKLAETRDVELLLPLAESLSYIGHHRMAIEVAKEGITTEPLQVGGEGSSRH